MLRTIPVLALAALASTAFASGPGQPAPLHVLLTNDDGFPISSAPPNTSAAGTVAVCQQLVAAGHRVTIVTPRRDQSGSSALINPVWSASANAATVPRPAPSSSSNAARWTSSQSSGARSRATGRHCAPAIPR